MSDNLVQKMDSIEKRLKKLENVVFSKDQKSSITKEYKGLKGGINFLIDSGFFNKLVSIKEIKNELKKEGYIYPDKSIDRAIRRDFHKTKILTREKENNVWKYALRK